MSTSALDGLGLHVQHLDGVVAVWGGAPSKMFIHN